MTIITKAFYIPGNDNPVNLVINTGVIARIENVGPDPFIVNAASEYELPCGQSVVVRTSKTQNISVKSKNNKHSAGSIEIISTDEQ